MVTAADAQQIKTEALDFAIAVEMPVEICTAQRWAEFLLSNTIDAADYTRAVTEVPKMGLDPAIISHQPPPGA